MVFSLFLAGGLPYQSLTVESISLSMIGGTLLHGLALADHIRMLQHAKRVAEDTARHNLEIRSEELEHLVAQRTAELEIARRHAESLATIDVLTGIFNRRGLIERAQREILLAQRSGHPLSVIFLISIISSGLMTNMAMQPGIACSATSRQWW